MRPPKPRELVEWEVAMARGRPRFCHTCWHYTSEGICSVAGSRPPDNFTAMAGMCQDYEEDVPF